VERLVELGVSERDAGQLHQAQQRVRGPAGCGDVERGLEELFRGGQVAGLSLECAQCAHHLRGPVVPLGPESLRRGRRLPCEVAGDPEIAAFELDSGDRAPEQDLLHHRVGCPPVDRVAISGSSFRRPVQVVVPADEPERG
jgi:hypothetical protein